MPSDIDPALLSGNTAACADYRAQHFLWSVTDRVGVITLNRPERKNPLTFDSYAELRDLFRQLQHAADVRAVVIRGAGENFCSGGDVHEIIGPLTRLEMPELILFTRMTGDVVKALRACPQPVISAVDGICAGAGAILAMASDLRYGTARSKVAFLFTRVGLAGCDMGACAMLPRIIGQGRASELLYTGRAMSGDEGERWGFFNRLVAPESVLADAQALARDLVKAMRGCPQPIVAAVDGVCAGAGAIVAMASDLRLGTARSKTAFLFNRVGLAGCDMGACAILPRIIGQGRASELLYSGRSMSGEEGERWGFFNRLAAPETVLADAQALARELAAGPTFANGITKTMLHHEWAMTLEQAIEAEAQAQALCMLTQDFRRAYDAFVAKQRPVFQGN